MSNPNSLFLIGPMGTGKSSIGRQLANRLKRPFWDSDQALVKRTGVDIATIFEIEGEAGFRQRESRVLDELTQLPGIVLATGGGAILLPQNRQWLRTRGHVVYLRASVETQLERTARDRTRPLLQGVDRRATLTELFRLRDPLYVQTADLIIDSDDHSIPEILNRIAATLR